MGRHLSRHLIVLPLLVASGCAAPVPQLGAVRAGSAPRPPAEPQIIGRRATAMPQSLAQAHPHPRLMATDEDLQRVKKLVATDPVAKQWSDRVLSDARKAAARSVIVYKPDKGLETARQLQQTITHLALAYRLTGDAKFRDRARAELLSAARWPTWDPPSFLATAETTASVAIGYDWLYPDLSPDERATISRAILAKGLRPALVAYNSGNQSWVEARHNWNLVCNGGMIVGALAVMDESPDLAREVLARAQRSIANGLEAFAPDGGWEEGPTYWNYGTRYIAFAVASLRTTFGSLGGFEKFPGVSRTGDFRMHTVGPSGKNFNFADSAENPGDSPQMFALAWAYKRPAQATWERDRSHTDPSVFDLVWYQPDENVPMSSVPTAAFFRNVGVAALRSAWDPKATYVAFKGGSNRAHHGHLDLGTFVLDAQGERWAIDLGSDNYDLPSKSRWTYYRYSTAGHNTLTFGGGRGTVAANQVESAEAPLIAFHQSPDRSHAAVDLTDAYGPNAKRVLRGIALLNGRDVLVQDEVTLAHGDAVQWSMHTRAKVDLDGRTATLRQNGKTLTARLLYPPGVKFEVESAHAPPPQDPNEGVAKLVIRFTAKEPTHIAVLFSPGAGEAPIPKLQPVSWWADDAKLRAPSPASARR